jgi:predicted phosphate transport protein (TIGR00153 family)
MSLIANLFGQSPIRPMQQHMKAAVECARQILPLFEEMVAGDKDAIAVRRREIDRLEHEADRIKNEIRSNLPKRMFLAVERRDMLEILDYQDSIADVAQDIAELADMRGMVVPEGLASAFLELVRRVVSACEQAERVINELDELVETGFRGREVARVDQMIEELSRMETDTDGLEERVQRLLFEIEDELGISAIFWYKLIDYVGGMADYAERVGNRLRLLTAN